MKKIDYKKELKHLYAPSSKEISIADVPTMNYLVLAEKVSDDMEQFKNVVR